MEVTPPSAKRGEAGRKRTGRREEELCAKLFPKKTDAEEDGEPYAASFRPISRRASHPGGMAENSPYGELPIRAIMGT
jgi:hypothetical protein